VFLLPYLATLPLQFVLRHSLWSLKCSFDRYLKLWKVVFRHGRLIRRGRRNVPYVYCFSDSFSMKRDPLQQKLDDRYYDHHRNPVLIVKTVVKAFIYRMFITNDMV